MPNPAVRPRQASAATTKYGFTRPVNVMYANIAAPRPRSTMSLTIGGSAEFFTHATVLPVKPTVVRA